MPERFLVYRPQPTPVQFLNTTIPTHPYKLDLTNPYSRFPPTFSPPGHQGPFNDYPCKTQPTLPRGGSGWMVDQKCCFPRPVWSSLKGPCWPGGRVWEGSGSKGW